MSLRRSASTGKRAKARSSPAARLARVGVRAEAQVLLHRQLGEGPPALHHLGDAAPHDRGRAQVVDGPVVQGDRALGDLAVVRVEQPADRPQQRGLAGAVGAQQRDDLARGTRRLTPRSTSITSS